MNKTEELTESVASEHQLNPDRKRMTKSSAKAWVQVQEEKKHAEYLKLKREEEKARV